MPDSQYRLEGYNSQTEVISFIVRNKCCTVYFFGHQGGDKGNLGGHYAYDYFGNEIFLFGPKAENEAEFGAAFRKVGCIDCAINLFTCGGGHDGDDQYKVRNNRIDTANATGCTVCGSTKLSWVTTNINAPITCKDCPDAGVLSYLPFCVRQAALESRLR